MYPKNISFRSPLDKKSLDCPAETKEYLQKVVDGTTFSMPSENVLVIEYPADLVKKVHLVSVDETIVRIDFKYAIDHFLHECFFPSVPWTRENFFRNGRFKKCKITFSEGKSVIEAPHIVSEPGSVSHATLRPEDLIPAFLRHLDKLDPDAVQEFKLANPNLMRAIRDEENGTKSKWWMSQEAIYVMEDIFDLMEKYAPEGYTFTSHPGDASDFGYWKDDDVMDTEEALETLSSHLKEHGLHGVELTEEDAEHFLELIGQGLTRKEAINKTLSGIRDTLDAELED